MKKLCTLMLLAAASMLAQPIEAKVTKVKKQQAIKAKAVKQLKQNDSSSSSSSSSSCNLQEPEFGYFYLTTEQTVEGGDLPAQVTLISGDSVNWLQAGSVNTDAVFIDSSDANNIILKKPGYYLATFILTGEQEDIKEATAAAAATTTPQTPVSSNQFQFALYLNDSNLPISGSTYAANTCCQYAPVQLNGQVVFRVNAHNSRLRLVNQCEFDVELENDAGTNYPDQFGPNVSGSLVIQRLSNLQFE